MCSEQIQHTQRVQAHSGEIKVNLHSIAFARHEVDTVRVEDDIERRRERLICRVLLESVLAHRSPTKYSQLTDIRVQRTSTGNQWLPKKDICEVISRNCRFA